MTGRPGGLQSMGLQRVGHDRVTEQQQFEVHQLPDHVFQSLGHFQI